MMISAKVVVRQGGKWKLEGKKKGNPFQNNEGKICLGDDVVHAKKCDNLASKWKNPSFILILFLTSSMHQLENEKIINCPYSPYPQAISNKSQY